MALAKLIIKGKCRNPNNECRRNAQMTNSEQFPARHSLFVIVSSFVIRLPRRSSAKVGASSFDQEMSRSEPDWHIARHDKKAITH
jgi:hypothetical protein